jgi:hypothetical protein
MHITYIVRKPGGDDFCAVEVKFGLVIDGSTQTVGIAGASKQRKSAQ